MEKEKKNKFQFSKVIVVVACIIFLICLYKGFTADYSTMIDVSFYVTAITVSGSLFSATIIWYLKKSQSENNVKLKIEMYKVASRERIKYNAKMMLLKKNLEMSDDVLMDIENGSPMVGFEDQALSSINEVISAAENDADTLVELQNY